MPPSNKQVYKLSKTIKNNNGKMNEDELLLLQNYRTSYTQPLSSTFHKIRRITDKIDRDAIVAFRLKRIETIVNKLLRLPDTFITTMGDIAGLRCIFKSKEDVYQALELIKNKFKYDDNVRDYIKNPKSIGYKGVHIYIKDASSGKKIEIQLRTIKDHNWATLVEITDLLYGLRLKELNFESDRKFAQFHALMSSDKELSKEEAFLIYEILKEKKFISKLSSTFLKNNNEVKKRWAEQKKNHSFFLIEASKEQVPTLKSFRSFKWAEDEYFKRYQQNINSEIVLTSIRKPNFKQMSTAYANYILSYHTFINDIKPILKEMAIEAIENKELYKFKNIFKTYEELHANVIIDALTNWEEIYFSGINNKGKVQLELTKNYTISQRKQIINKLDKKLMETGKEHKKFIDEILAKIPNDFFSKFRCRYFLKRHNKRLKKRFAETKFEFESIKK